MFSNGEAEKTPKTKSKSEKQNIDEIYCLTLHAVSLSKHS